MEIYLAKVLQTLMQSYCSIDLHVYMTGSAF